MKDAPDTAPSEVLPLTPSQEGMLLELLRGDGSGGVLVGVIAADICGPVDAEAIHEALLETVANRPALRAAFVWRGMKNPVQVVHGHVDLPVRVVDWSDMSADAMERAEEGLIAQERARHMDLSKPPLMRLTLAQVSATRHRLIWTVHHAICDGWSAGPLLDELRQRLNGQAAEPDLALKRYLVWRKKRAMGVSGSFWQDYLRDAVPAVELDLPEPPCAGPGLSVASPLSIPVPKDVEARAAALARRLRMTLPNLLAAVHALCLRRYGAGDDVLFGMTNAGRPAEVPGIENSVGAYLNTLPVRSVIDASLSGQAYLTAFAEQAEARRSHEFGALRDVLAQSGFRTGRELFNSIFVYEGIPSPSPEQGRVKITDPAIFAPSEANLSLLYMPGDRPVVQVHYDASRHSRAGARAFASDFVTILEQLVAHPALPLRDLLRGGFPPAKTENAKKPILNLAPLPDAIWAQAGRTPDALAVVSDEGSLSYVGLTGAANAVASKLRAKGIGRGDIVPVIAPRGLAAIVGILGVLRAGAAYVPIDTDYPWARNARILSEVGPKVAVVAPGLDLPLDQRVTSVSVIFEETLDRFDALSPDLNDLAYVLFTSGSQGVPKGVEISHGNLAYSTGVRTPVYGGDPTCFMVFSSLAFDSSVAGTFWALGTGGTLALAPPGAILDPFTMLDRVRDWGVDYLLCLPSLFRVLVEAGRPEDLAGLRTAIVAGEPLDERLVELHRRILPRTRLVNEYGPTEGTVWCCSYDATDHSCGDVPIGRAIPGSEIVIADPDGGALPNGAVGQILLAGPGVFQGYLNDPERTAAAKIGPGAHGAYYVTGDVGRVDHAGRVHFLGRTDQQIKIRGHRVEPAEVEAEILDDPNISHTAVVAVGQADHVRLCAFISPEVAGLVDKTIARLARNLPAYMRPDHVVALGAWPSLPNGKTDKPALVAMAQELGPVGQTDGEAARTFHEKAIAEIWQKVLGTDSIGRHDDFFQIGGDSLKSVHVMLEAEKSGISLQPYQIFDTPRLSDLAAALDARVDVDTAAPDLNRVCTIRADATEGALVMIHGSQEMCAHLSAAIGDDFGLIFHFSAHLAGEVQDHSLTEAAERIVSHVIAARPTGPIWVGGYSAGGLIAIEVARMLEQSGRAPERMFLLDPSWEIGGFETHHGQFVRPIAFARRLGLGALTIARIAALRLARSVRRGDDAVRVKLVGHTVRRQLLTHHVRAWSGPVSVYLSQEAGGADAGENWVEQVFVEPEVTLMPFGHLALQSDKEALFDWTARVARIMR